MDKVFIEDLEVEAIIGIWDREKKTKQKIRLDIEMSIDAKSASIKDTIDFTLNYQEVAERVSSFTAESRFNLVETLAEKICKLIIEEFLVKWVKVKVSKIKVVKSSSFVGVTIQRTSEGY
ncbi:MAG: dihydroneopterin aldolase [Gammaproteobacteria bacterium TMED78]|nr:MAG: dihydroneopterin aldolase [Gammaproteobacteria bacterium TMED78]